MCDKPNLATIILAAGSSSRMGVDKLLLPIADQPMLQIIAQKAQAANLNPHIVVRAETREAINAALNHQYPLILAPEATLGQAYSLRAGLAYMLATQPTLTGLMVMLGDQPGIQLATLQLLHTTFMNNTYPKHALAPSYQGRRGHPVIIPAHLFPSVLQLQHDMGARQLIISYLHELPVNDSYILLDLDTPTDYKDYIHANAL